MNKTTTPLLACFAMTLMFLSACDSTIRNNQLTEKEKSKVLMVQNPFGANRVEVPQQKGLFLGLKDCTIYRSISSEGVITAWETSLSKPFYPLGICSRSELTVEGDYVQAFLCVLGMGAGGGCSAGGNYRTQDGRVWEKEARGKWVKEE